MPEKYAVMGNPISHSLSPLIHQLFAKQTGLTLTYEKIQIDLPRFEQQVSEFFTQGGKGLNITLPCKQQAFTISQKRTSRCLEASAANTLWMQEGYLYADNTDGIGLLRDLNRHVNIRDKKILLLGAGGAARGILGPLLAAYPAQLTIANRTLKKAQILQQDFPKTNYCTFDDLKHKQYDIIINATSASLDGKNLELPEQLMSTQPFCYDLAYKKNQPTAFVAWAKRYDCRAIDGLGMLIEQAAEAFFIWHGIMPNTAAIVESL